MNWNTIKIGLGNFRDKSLDLWRREWLRWCGFSRRRKALSISLFLLFFVLPLILLSKFERKTHKAHGNIVTFDITAPETTDFANAGAPHAVSVRFTDSAARIDLIRKDVTKYLSISPNIVGTWSWESQARLEFTPSVEWLPGATYRVEMGRELFAPLLKIAKYSFEFQAPEFSVRLTDSNFYQDPRLPDLKKVVATAVFSHPVDPATLESRISMKLYRGAGEEAKGVPLATSVTYDKSMTKAFIHSIPLKVTQDDGRVDVTIDGGVASSLKGNPSKEKAEATISVPNIYTMFQVAGCRMLVLRDKNYDPEPVLAFEFTNGVTEEEVQKNIEIYELPVDLPSLKGASPVKNFHWSGVRMTPEVLAFARKLTPQAVPTEQEYSKLHSFRLKTTEKRHIYVKLNNRIPSFGGYLLHNAYESIQRVPDFPRELSIMQNGAILTLSGDKRLPIIARGIEALQGEIWRVSPGQINHVISQSYGEFRNPQFNYNFGPENIAQRVDFERNFPAGRPGQTNYVALDLGALLPRDEKGLVYGLFFIKVKTKQGWDLSDSRMIMVTDLGIIAKNNKDGSHTVFVQSLRSGDPAVGASVLVLGKNGIPLVKKEVDSAGRAELPPLTSFNREREPVAYVAVRGNDLVFMPYSWNDREINYSRFDIGGALESGTPNELSAYVFSDRGIYRPGDEMRAAFIVKSADWKSAVGGLPLETVITDARGLEVYNRRIRLESSGFSELLYKLDDNAPTGAYDISIYITRDNKRAGLLGSAHIKVEEFVPDRMKISVKFSKENPEGWISPEKLEATVSVQNLFGTPAEGRKVKSRMIFLPMPFSFAKYRDYFFASPQPQEKSFQEELEEAATAADGTVTYELDTARFDQASFLVRFLADAFEKEGGRSVGAEASAFVSNLKYIVGYKPDGSLEFVNKGATRSVHLIALDNRLAKTSVRNLEMRLLEQRYVSSLTKNENGTFSYASVLKEIPLSKKDLAVPAAGVDMPLDTSSPGDFKLQIIDKANGAVLCSFQYSVAGHANITRSLEKNAELQIKLDSKDYSAGENIAVQIRAPYSGAGLITIERDKVYAWKWFQTSGNATTEHITLPDTVEGNAYVNVVFLRSVNSPEIFMSPLSYGIAPFTISRERRTNKVTLNVPSLIKPGEKLRVGFKTVRPAKITVYAVDEGILQVAAYKLPDPLSFFLRKKELSVRTRQILDLLLPEFRLLGLGSAPGGDKDWGAIGKNLNPFKRKRDKPVAFWSGIIDSGPEEKFVDFSIPGYFNGSLKVMAVAVSSGSIGTAEMPVTVRGPFVLSPNAPFAVSPGDEFEFSAGVMNNLGATGGADNLRVQLAVTKHLQLLDGSVRNVSVPRMREGAVKFRLKAMDLLGAAEISLTVSSGAVSVASVSGVSVRPPVLHRTNMQAGSIRNTSAVVAVGRPLYPEYRILSVSASQIPLISAWGAITYLDNFPFTCTEQLVSKAFPALLLGRRPEFGLGRPEDINARLQEAVRIIRSRQGADGGVGLWGPLSPPDNFATLYAMHFMTEAVARGYEADRDILTRGSGFMKQILRRSPGNMDQARECSYALYLLIKNGDVLAGDLESLRRALDNNAQFKSWQNDLTGMFMASSYALLQKKPEADMLIAKAVLKADAQGWDGIYSSVVRSGMYLYLLSKHFPERLPQVSAETISAMAEAVSKTPNTIGCAVSVMGLDAYTDYAQAAKPMSPSITAMNSDKTEAQVVLPVSGLYPKTAFSEKAAKLKIADASGLNIFYQVVEAGFDRVVPQKSESNGLEVFRTYVADGGKEVSEVPMGAQVEVVVRLRATGNRLVPNIAVVDILPGGFEVAQDSLRNPSPAPAKSESQDCDSEEGCEDAPGPQPGGGQGAAGFIDYREDRVVFYAAANTSVQEFSYKIQATSKGVFLVPPLYAVSMYDNRINANSQPGVLTVK